MVNTQLETGDFVDLFKTSDAMIHDCGSFTAEYLYVNKPVAFVSDNIEQLKIPHSDFGRAALDQHYILKDKDDVLAFINDVVLGGNDSKKEQRTRFFETVLKPDVTGTTSQFIVNDIKKSLGLC
jgi:CDP-glycerol glycerophosphotransferase (TagB/SpsB family)